MYIKNLIESYKPTWVKLQLEKKEDGKAHVLLRASEHSLSIRATWSVHFPILPRTALPLLRSFCRVLGNSNAICYCLVVDIIIVRNCDSGVPHRKNER